MANAETMLKVLLAGMHVWLKGKPLPLHDLTGVPKALWLLQGTLEGILHELEGRQTIPEEEMNLYDDAIRNLGFLLAFLDDQPDHIHDALKDEISTLEDLYGRLDQAIERRGH